MTKNNSISFYFLFLLLLPFHALKSQDVSFEFDANGKINLNHSWKFHNGDSMQWASTSFDDSKWDTLNTEMYITKLPKGKFSGNAWFRLQIKPDSSVIAKKAFSLLIDQQGASEIFLDGNKIATYGKIGNNHDNEVRYDPGGIPIAVNLIPGKEHVIAIRYSNHEMDYGFNDDDLKKGGFSAKLVDSNNYLFSFIETRDSIYLITLTLFGFFIALGISHLLIYLFYRAYKSNLYYFIFIFFMSCFPLTISLESYVDDIHINTSLQLFSIIDIPLFFTSFLTFLYSIFYEKIPKQIWIFWGVAAICIAGLFISIIITVICVILLVMGTSVEAIRIILIAIRKKKNGARIIGLGGIFLATFMISLIVLTVINGGLQLSGGQGQLFLILLLFCITCLPICMSIHLAREFAQTNRSLSKQLKEVEILSAKSIEQEKEKQKLLETEKDRLEIQVNERTSEISEQKKIIEEKNKDITDSIHYAKKIQDAMLPAIDVTKQLFPESFILFQPKDIVSGDFYWIAETSNSEPNTPNSKLFFIAAADCTGHGVPGALMSMTGNNFLNQIVIERNNSSTAEILSELDFAIRKSLKQERADVESKDGMDIALCRFTNDFSELLFSGANRPLWIVRENELLEFKAVKRSIGGIQSVNAIPFSETKIDLQKNDCIYIFSDGFADQFGGPEGKKFMTKRLKELLVSINSLSMEEQQLKLEVEMNAWRGELTQVDDLLLIGIKI